MFFTPISLHKFSVPPYFSPQEDDDTRDDHTIHFDPTSMIDFFKNHEKSVPYMYRDTKGYVTVGVGHMIPSRTHATELPFQYHDPLTKKCRPATPREIENAYEQLPGRQGHQNNFSYTYYNPPERGLLPLYLHNHQIDDLLKNDIQIHYNDVRDKFDDFDTYPVSAQRALLDMQFNMGGRFNVKKWPKLYESIRNQQWSEAAYHAHRYQVHDKRNECIKNLFFDAWRDSMGYVTIHRQT